MMAKTPNDRCGSMRSVCVRLEAATADRAATAEPLHGRSDNGALPHLPARLDEYLLRQPGSRLTPEAGAPSDLGVDLATDLLNQPNVVAIDRPSSGVRVQRRSRWRVVLVAGVLLLAGAGVILVASGRGRAVMPGEAIRPDADGLNPSEDGSVGDSAAGLSEATLPFSVAVDGLDAPLEDRVLESTSLYDDLMDEDVWSGTPAWNGDMADTTWHLTRGTSEFDITFHDNGKVEFPETVLDWKQEGDSVSITGLGVPKRCTIEMSLTETGEYRYFLRGHSFSGRMTYPFVVAVEEVDALPEEQDQESTSLYDDLVDRMEWVDKPDWNGDIANTTWHLTRTGVASSCDITFRDNGWVIYPLTSHRWKQKGNVVRITDQERTKKCAIELLLTERGDYNYFLRGHNFSAELTYY